MDWLIKEGDKLIKDLLDADILRNLDSGFKINGGVTELIEFYMEQLKPNVNQDDDPEILYLSAITRIVVDKFKTDYFSVETFKYMFMIATLVMETTSFGKDIGLDDMQLKKCLSESIHKDLLK